MAMEGPIGAVPILTNQTAIMKGSGVDFTIQLQETPVSINGQLICNVHQPQHARKVEVIFRAWEWVLFGYDEQVSSGGNSRSEHRVHTETAVLINLEQIVWADPSGVLQPGNYQFPFSFAIGQLSAQYCSMDIHPDNDHRARVSFTVEANIDIPWWADKSLKIEALIVPRPLLPPPLMMQPVFATEGFNMTSCYLFCCCPSGVVETTCTVGPNAAFSLASGGISGNFTLVARNKSGINVKQLYYYIEEELQLKLNFRHHGSNQPARKFYGGMIGISGPTGNITLPPGADINVNIPFSYPAMNLHPHGQFVKFNVSHNLVVMFESDGTCAPNHHLRVPIFLAGSLAAGQAPAAAPPPGYGPPQGGYPPQGYPPQGYPPQGPPQPGYSPQGPPGGYPQQNAPPAYPSYQ